MSDSASDLIDGYLDGRLTPEQGELLQQLLRDDPEARAMLRRRATIDEGLIDLATAASVANQSRPGEPNGSAADSGLRTEPKSLESGADLKTAARPAAGVRGSRMQIIIPWSVAAVLAFVLLSEQFTSPVVEPESPPQAKRTLGLLVDEADAQFEDGYGPENVKFDSGEYRLAKGAIHLRLENGADILMKSPASFRIDDAFHLTLHDGAIRAIAPLAARGFIVATPGMDYEDLGTEFGVAVDQKSGANELHVFDGQVDARGSGSKKLVASVTQGQSVALNHGVLEPTDSPQEGRFLAPGAIGFLRWQAHCAELAQDPDLIGFYPFVEAETLKNHAAHALSSDGQIEGARWTSSRWPGKSALLFDRDDDFVRLTIPGEYDEFTIASWVNVDRLDYEYNALLNSDRFDPGDLHFQINRRGLVWANVMGRPPSARASANNPLQLGKWQHVVGVISITEKKHRTYVNGELMGEQDCPSDLRVTPGECRLGNWLAIPNWHHVPNRAFKGRMDEVAIWKRSLTAQEIKAHYEAGRPSLLDK
jgi:hypothetical protein